MSIELTSSVKASVIAITANSGIMLSALSSASARSASSIACLRANLSASSIKPITYLKNHAAELVRGVSESSRTVLITQNGEAKVVVMNVETYDRWQSALALMKIVAHSEADIESGRTAPQEEAFARVKQSLGKKARKSRKK